MRSGNYETMRGGIDFHSLTWGLWREGEFVSLLNKAMKTLSHNTGFWLVMVYLGKEIKMNIDNTKERIFTKASKIFEMILKESNVGFSDVNSKSNVKEIVLMVNKMTEWFNQNT